MTEIKESVQFLKRVIGKMVQSIKLLEGETEVKNKGNRKQKNESDSKVDHEKKEEQKSSQEKGEQGFKCEKCDYRAKRKNTLNKHMNTKHGDSIVIEERDKLNTESAKDKNTEKIENKKKTCEKCESCEKCDYMNNGDTCEMCKMLMYAWAGKQCGVEF